MSILKKTVLSLAVLAAFSFAAPSFAQLTQSQTGVANDREGLNEQGPAMQPHGTHSHHVQHHAHVQHQVHNHNQRRRNNKQKKKEAHAHHGSTAPSEPMTE